MDAYPNYSYGQATFVLSGNIYIDDYTYPLSLESVMNCQRMAYAYFNWNSLSMSYTYDGNAPSGVSLTDRLIPLRRIKIEITTASATAGTYASVGSGNTKYARIYFPGMSATQIIYT